MSQGVGVVGLYVRDQDEALQFYVEKLGFRVHTDARNGDYRWLTVQHPDQPSSSAVHAAVTDARRGDRADAA
jgi:catechol 2,3-dioxygenase-like lactoylglutathione lyase family enzyme